MGHFIFFVFHIIAILFGAVWLIITIPLHLIYGALKSGQNVQQTQNVQMDD